MANYKIINTTPTTADFWWRQPLINEDGSFKKDEEGNIEVEQMVVRSLDPKKISDVETVIASGKTFIQEEVTTLTNKIAELEAEITTLKNTSSCSANHLIQHLTGENSYSLVPKNYGVYDITLSAPDSIINIDRTGLDNKSVAEVKIYLKQGTGSNTVTWTTDIKWMHDLMPILATEAGKVDIVVLTSVDGGNTWFGAIASKWGS